MAIGDCSGVESVLILSKKNFVGILKLVPLTNSPSEVLLDKLPPTLATRFNLFVKSCFAVTKNSEFNSPNELSPISNSPVLRLWCPGL